MHNTAPLISGLDLDIMPEFPDSAGAKPNDDNLMWFVITTIIMMINMNISVPGRRGAEVNT